MIIESISLKNFQCYYGEHAHNTFNFKTGLNLIIGNNGSGKSKLFDAFFWVIYDQVFDSFRRRFVSTSDFREKLISDKAKKLCTPGQRITTEVVLKALSSQERPFRITRMLQASKTDENSWSCEKKSKLLIDEYKVSGWQSVEESKHAAILSTVIPDSLKTYMWFQGEQVDSLMNLTDKDALTRIINLISKMQDYDELIGIVKKGEAKATKNFRAAQKKVAEDKGKFDDLEKRLVSVEAGIEKMKESLTVNGANLQEAKDYIDQLIGLVGDAEARAETKKTKQALEMEIDISHKMLNDIHNGLHKNLFTDSWVLRNAQPFFDGLSEKYNVYFVEHARVANKVNEVVVKLPINVPQPIHVNQMLQDETCYVCGRDAKQGSPEYEHIKSLLGRDEIKEGSLFKYDCSKFFLELYNNGLGFTKYIQRIDSNISDVFDRIEKLRGVINNARAKLKKIRDEFGESLESDQSHDIVRAFRIHEANREKFQSLINNEEECLRKQLLRKKELTIELESLVKSSGGNIDPETKISYEIFSDLLEVAEGTKSEVFEDLIKQLESSANMLFKMMTKDNMAITGNIRINCSSHSHCVAQIVGSDGAALTNPNDSNLVLVKLALIMAIIQSRGTWSDNFAFISDAPTSKMAAEYSNGFYKTIGSNFKQSIVTTYDFVRDEDRAVLREFNASTAHLIAPKYPSGDSNDSSDLSIKVEELSW